jgi:hypothetical protein
MSWPTCPKSKKIVKIVEECERTIFGEENQAWSPRTDLSHLILVKRINKILEEIGHKENIDKKKIYEKTRIIAHNLGVSFWDESESDTDSEKGDESDDEHQEDENH